MKKKKPVAAVVVKKKKKRLPQNTDACCQAFFHGVNWADWYEEFHTSIRANGRYRYKGICSFAKVKAANPFQRKFMIWYLGPKTEETSPFPWCKAGPQDWFARRKTGGWFTEASVRELGKEVSRRMTALDALRAAGNGITLNSLVRAEQLAQEVDRSFKGRMFLDNLSMSQNLARAEAYVSLHAKILDDEGAGAGTVCEVAWRQL